MNEPNISPAAAECARGDIYYITREDKNRPAVIVSNDMYNRYSDDVEIVYLTSQIKKPLPTHVEVMAQCPSIAKCESIHTVSKEMLGTYITTCTDEEMEQIDKALCCSLDIQFPEVSEQCTAEINALKTELTIYKRMYDELLERLIGVKQ